jgi:MarR family transcriptional regulator, organic hydroperoxide resistance regulator
MHPPTPPDSLDFLLAQICHLHHTRAHQLLESLGLYRGQPPVLRALWEQEGLAQSELAKRLKITPATCTKMLQRMEKAGFIERVADEIDQRVMRVYLTETGYAIQNQVVKVWETMDTETFTGISSEDLASLRGLLLHIRQNLLDATGESAWK